MEFIQYLEKSPLSHSDRCNLEFYHSKRQCLENINRNQCWFYEDLNYENCIISKVDSQVSDEDTSESKLEMNSLNVTDKSILRSLLLKNEDHDVQTTPKKFQKRGEPSTPSSNWKMLTTVAASLSYADGNSVENDKNSALIDASDKENIDLSLIFNAAGSKNVTRRKDKSLGLICQRFLALYPEYPSSTDRIIVGIYDVAKQLGVERRRIYDIVNVLESLELLTKIGKNKYRWFGKCLLLNTLRKLQASAKKENVAEQIHAMKDIEVMKSLEGNSSDGTSAEAQCMSFSPKKDRENSNKHFLTDGRKEKSLGLMSLKFLMLFLTTAPKVLNLDLAAKVLIGNSNSEILNGDESIKFKTKVRRLYDIANILSSLGLIQKVYVTELRGRKPAFQYIGPDLKDFEEDGIECENFLSLQSFMNENSLSSSVQSIFSSKGQA
ncbi:transcription factor E2F7-like isoform X3 [Centruroides vittatus]|uniref:transcription factor E2F7-like isoform X3 n=1 Tax=Centruroides vittatus TaxID=120091 RepID=UPI00350EB613